MTALRIALLLIFASFATVFSASAASISLDFEEERFGGLDSANRFGHLGIWFPSGPHIERLVAFTGILGPAYSGQVLQQGYTLPRIPQLEGQISCRPLEIEFDPALNVRSVTMKVINNHLSSYAVRAFSENGLRLIDDDHFTAVPPEDRFLRLASNSYRTVRLASHAGGPDITRVVVNAPIDCSNPAAIDDLSIEALNDPDPSWQNSVSVAAYEVSQGVMSRLTWDSDRGNLLSGVPVAPDTRLMAAPSKRLPFISERDTGMRFFLTSSRERMDSFDGQLEVTITYRDGTNSRKILEEENTENSTGDRESIIPHVLPGTNALELKRDILMRRANIDQSLDFVIPGASLENASRVTMILRKSMRDSRGSLRAHVELARVVFQLEGPYSLGANLVRVVGKDEGSFHSSFASLDLYATVFSSFIDDLFPTSNVDIRKQPDDIELSQQFTNKDTLLNKLIEVFERDTDLNDRTFSSDFDYWLNVFLVRSAIEGSGTTGLGLYNSPNAFVNWNPGAFAHEMGHTMGLDHATNLHGEGGGWEGWPYHHGSIGTIDEAKPGHEDGVFGLIMHLVTPDADLESDWGRWRFSPVSPCQSGNKSEIFPDCTVDDSKIVHDFMTYFRGIELPFYSSFFTGTTHHNWISDINYYRVVQFLKSCAVLDPPGRTWGVPEGLDPQTTGTSNNENCRAAQ